MSSSKTQKTPCKIHKGELHPHTNMPIDKNGEYILFGYRRCGLLECINPEHHTLNIRQGRTLKGTRPTPLFKKRPTITGEQINRIAKPLLRYTEPDTCQVPNCHNKHRAANLCGSHHAIWLKWRKANGMTGRIRQDFTEVLKYVQPASKRVTMNNRHCHVPNCDRPFLGRGLCKMHHNRFQRAAGSNS